MFLVSISQSLVAGSNNICFLSSNCLLFKRLVTIYLPRSMLKNACLTIGSLHSHFKFSTNLISQRCSIWILKLLVRLNTFPYLFKLFIFLALGQLSFCALCLVFCSCPRVFLIDLFHIYINPCSAELVEFLRSVIKPKNI